MFDLYYAKTNANLNSFNNMNSGSMSNLTSMSVGGGGGGGGGGGNSSSGLLSANGNPSSGKMSSVGNLYSKNILVRLTNSKMEEKFKSIHITVDYQTTNIPTHKTELIIKLTDEYDPFFLYSLYMSEEDYQTLKVQQGLLVDFHAFGQRFIDLLYACEKDEKSDSPKFQLQFYSKEPLPYDTGHASLNVIEINPFKHLCHLSLNFTPGNDNDVKKYLANCLVGLREDFNKLARTYEDTKAQLTQKLDGTQQMLAQKTMEYDKLKIELDAQSERLITKHMQELNFEKDKSLQTQYAAQQKFEKDKKEIELNLLKTIKQLESRLAEFETNNKDLMEKKYKYETQLQELKLKNASLQDDYNGMKLELSNFKKENSSLDMELHSNEKLINQLKTRIAVLEQELKDKADSMNKSQELLNNEQTQRKQLDELLKEKAAELKKKQAEINHYVDEFKKGNEVVNKLQEREKSLVNQIKLKTRILNEQEKVMKEKEKQLDDLTSDNKELNRQMSILNDENKELKSTIQKKIVELEEAAKIMKRDEGVISYLNKQITDKQMNNMGTGGNAPKMVTYEMNNSGSFRPYGTLLTTNNHFINSNISSSSAFSNSMDPSGVGDNGGLIKTNSTVSQPLANGTLGNQYKSNELDLNHRLNGNYTANNIKNALMSASSASVQQTDHLKENLEMNSALASRMDLNGKIGLTSNTNSVTKLDPKYFQNHQLAPVNQFDLQAKHTLIKANLVGNSGVTVSNQNAISVPKSSKSTPSLASAYFPNQQN